MNYLFRPYSTFLEWRDRQRRKCIITIDNPPMRFKGKPYQNKTDDPNFPTFIAFFGVPYAAPPVGPLRFQPPQPLPATRSGRIPLLKAYKTDHASLQYGPNKREYYGKEDCLYLNIYMLRKPEESPGNLPVLVFIHGGGFQRGSGDIVDVEPDAIIRQNVIFVTVNYRLCLSGFLNMGTADCRGNAGLKDQVQALKWIRANIDRFGGDPYNVTLTGHSSGATCVNLHMISPLSEGLFKRAIVKAGGIHCPWGYQGIQKKPRRLLALAYGLENELRSVLMEVLKYEEPHRLLEITKRIVNDMISIKPTKFMIFCGPSKEVIPKDAFIPCDLEELKTRAKPVPLIAGLAEQEGYMYILVKWHRYQEGFSRLIQWDREFTDFLRYNFNWSSRTALRFKDTLRDKYFPNLSQLNEQQIQDHLATLCTDIWFRRFYDNFRIGPSTPPYFVYKFWYLAENDQIRWTDCRSAKLCITGWLQLPFRVGYDVSKFLKYEYHSKAPSHGDELNYLYNPSYLKSLNGGTISAQTRHVMDHICSMWGNFCRSGVPTSNIEPELIWRPHTDYLPNYLNIGITSTLIPSRLYGDRWNELNDMLVGAESRESSQASSEQALFNVRDLRIFAIQSPFDD